MILAPGHPDRFRKDKLYVQGSYRRLNASRIYRTH